MLLYLKETVQYYQQDFLFVSDHTGYTEMKDDVMKKPGEVFRNRNASETMRNSPSMSNREVADALAGLIKRGQNLRSKMMFSAIEPPQPPNELLDHRYHSSLFEVNNSGAFARLFSEPFGIYHL